MGRLLSIGALIIFGSSVMGCAAAPQSPPEQWIPPGGRISLQNKQPPYPGGTAIDLWAPPIPEKTDSNAEITIHRCNEWSASTRDCMERLNLSAMAQPQYRLGIERGGTGEFRPLYFCFEDVTPGVAYCPMRMTPSDGIQFNISKPGQPEQWVSASALAKR